MSRADFSPQTRATLAARAGYRCSVPACRVTTVGPGAQADTIATTGAASHIFSASPHGPRGQGGLSLDELNGISNGIWLCHRHARLVDANAGQAFPASYLIAIRNLHEAWIQREQGDMRTPFGWIDEILIVRSDIFRADTRIRLGKVTMIFGDNDAGKSALCDWVAGAANPRALWRWRRGRENGVRLTYKISYFDPAERVIYVSAGDGQIRYELDRRPLPYNPVPFRVVSLTEPGRGFTESSDLQQIAQILSVSDTVVRNVLELKRPNSVFQFSHIDERESVFLGFRRAPLGFSWRQLSHGQQILIAIELAIDLASFEADYNPTILLLDWGVAILDDDALTYLASRLTSASAKFQTMIVCLPRRGLSWAGWQVASLFGTKPNVSLEQETVVLA